MKRTDRMRDAASWIKYISEQKGEGAADEQQRFSRPATASSEDQRGDLFMYQGGPLLRLVPLKRLGRSGGPN